jgi:transglutaminase-like putative cysteine protease
MQGQVGQSMNRARYRVIHETRYLYAPGAASARQLAHLSPRATSAQRIESHRIDITPTPTERTDTEDYFGNGVTRFATDEAFEEQVIHAESIVEITAHAPAPDAPSPSVGEVRDACAEGNQALRFELAQFSASSALAPVLAATADYARSSLPDDQPWLACLLALTRRVHAEFAFDPEATTLTTPVAEVLKNKRGVCQDFAHLMISCLRSLGLPARYVSGYILTHPPEGEERLLGADASHAWVAAWCPTLGWVDFDPTNGKLADTEFITLGWGRDFSDVTPLRGVVLASGSQELEVSVTVLPLFPPLSQLAPPAAQSQQQ